MQYTCLFIQRLIFLVLGEIVVLAVAGDAFLPYFEFKFADNKAAIEADLQSPYKLFWALLDPMSGQKSPSFYGSAQESMQATIKGTSVVPGYTPRLYQGSSTDAKAIFSSCKYWSVDKNRNKASGNVLSICECADFVYDPSNLNVRLPTSAGNVLFYLQPGVCQAGITCKGATADDAKAGCGPRLSSGGNSGSSNVNSTPGTSTSSSKAVSDSANNAATGLTVSGSSRVHQYGVVIQILGMIFLAFGNQFYDAIVYCPAPTYSKVDANVLTED